MKEVKICGLFRFEDIQTVNRYKPDYVGFIIDFPKSHRNIMPGQVKALRQSLSGDIKAVGVFVDKTVDFISSMIIDGTVDIPQLHGKEDNVYIAKLRQMLPESTPIWQAIQIKSDDDIIKANESSADFVILDAGQGGGVSFNWECLSSVNRSFGLAGGININNLPEALKTKASLLDISGGVETDKKKDSDKIELIINSIRG